MREGAFRPVPQLGTGLSEVLQLPNKIKSNGDWFRVPGICATKTQTRAMTEGLSSTSNGDRVRGNWRSWRRAGTRLLAASVAGLMVSGCGMSTLTSGMGGGMFGGTGSTGSPSRVTEESMLTSAKADGKGSASAVAAGCPRFQVAARDHHVTIYEPGRAGDSLGVMHRGEITRTARECNIEGSRVTVKYGFSGRILLGPRGHAGVVRLPVQVSVRDPKRAPIGADRTTVEASVTLDNPIAYFSQVRTVTFDVPEGSRAGDIDVFVGFEQTAPGAG